MKYVLFSLAMAFASLSQASAPMPFEGLAAGSYERVGSFKRELKNARIVKDTIFVAPVKKTFTRFTFFTYDPSNLPFPTAFLTLYYDEAGNVFTYFWDSGSLRSDFNNEGALFNENSWVQLTQKKNVLTGTTYPWDTASEKHIVTIENGRVTVETRGWEFLHIVVPIPTKTIAIFEKLP